MGASVNVASPEVLFARHLADHCGRDVLKVDGAAADQWSAGTTLFVMLTGDFPFLMSNQPYTRDTWRDALQAQRSWVR